MLIDDTNYWKTEEKLFRELMPSDGIVSSVEDACRIIKSIFSKRLSKKRKFWLLIFALTDRELMRPGPRRVFEHIMESKVLAKEEKAALCRFIIEEAGPFKPEYVLSHDQLRARDEKIKERVTKATEELKGKTPNNLIESIPFLVEI